MIVRPRISFDNMPSYVPTYDMMMNEVREITRADPESIFAFIVRFHGRPYNNFDLTVYLRESEEEEQTPIAVLNRGGHFEMKKLVEQWTLSKGDT